MTAYVIAHHKIAIGRLSETLCIRGRPLDVRIRSGAGVGAYPRHVRSCPDCRHPTAPRQLTLCAISRHSDPLALCSPPKKGHAEPAAAVTRASPSLPNV